MNRLALISSASTQKGTSPIVYPSDYVEWNPLTVVNDQPTGDADFFWHNPDNVGLRASLHFTGTGYSIVGNAFHFYIHPRTPDPGVIEGTQRYNYRTEFARRATVTIPVGSKEIVKCTYKVPDAGFKPRDTGFNIGQWHTGTGTLPGPGGLNSPVMSLDIANSGVPDKNADYSQQDEMVVVNKVTGNAGGNSGRVNTGFVLEPGLVFDMRQTLISGLGSAGYYKLEVREQGGDWVTLYEENEATVWAADSDGGSKSNVHPYWKLGLYQYGLVTSGGVTATEALNSGSGSYDIEISMPGKIKTAVLESDDPYYNSNAILRAFN
jgi:hypothetical protein